MVVCAWLTVSGILQGPTYGNWTFLSKMTGSAYGGAGSPVPEPPSILLLGGGLMLLGLAWRRGWRRPA